MTTKLENMRTLAVPCCGDGLPGLSDTFIIVSCVVLAAGVLIASALWKRLMRRKREKS